MSAAFAVELRRPVRWPVALVLGLVTLASCEAPGPLEVESPEVLALPAAPPPAPAPTSFGEAECTVDLREASLVCTAPGVVAPGPDGPAAMILNRQGVDVSLVSSGGSFVEGTFSVDVTVQNLIGQAIGTVNGVTPHADGVRVFFSTDPGPTVGSGSVTVANPDGTGTFTNPLQSYHEYAQLLEPQEVSEAKRWEFAVTGTVVSFQFRVMVSAEVQFPDGWVEVTPPTATPSVGGTVELAAQAYDRYGVPVTRTFAWSSSAEAVATVGSGTGLVTALSGGFATITATGDGDETPGTAAITVPFWTPQVADDFAGTMLDAKWISTPGTGGSITVDNRLVVGVANEGQQARVRFATAQDFTGGAFFAEISQIAASAADTWTFVSVTTSDQQQAAVLAVTGEGLTARTAWAGAASDNVVGDPITYDPVQHRFLRIRHAAGTIHFETSANGYEWTPFRTAASGFTESNLEQLYGTMGTIPLVDPGSNRTPAHFENANTYVPAIPRSLAAVSGEGLSVELDWIDRSVNESGFRIERRVQDVGSYALVGTVGADVTEFEDTTVQDGVVYQYRVRAFGPGGESAPTNAVIGSAEAPRPLLGTVVDDFAGSDLNAFLWEAENYDYNTPTVRSPAAAGLVVVDNRLETVGIDGTQQHSSIRTASAHRFRDTSFTVEVSQIMNGTGENRETFIAVVDTTYMESVIFSMNNENLHWYVQVSQGPQAGVYQPLGAVPSNATNHRFLRLRDAAGQVFYESSPTGASGSWTTHGSIDSPFLNPNHILGELGVGTWNPTPTDLEPAFFENVNTTVPAIPRELAAVPNGSLRIDLSWVDRSVNETEFQIERREVGVGSFQQIGTAGVNAQSHSDTSGLQGSISYEYRVRASGPGGESAYTNVATATAQP